MDLKTIMHALAPGLSARWYAKRAQLASAQRLYKAAAVSQFHPRRGDNRSANAVMDNARNHLSNWSRYLDENADLAVGVFNDLVDNIVGEGITVEPMVRMPNGELHADLNAEIRRLWDLWGRKPEASQVLPWGEVQRLMCRSWLRDGDLFAQEVINAPSYQYPTDVPYGLELLESDMVPFDLTMSQLTGTDDRSITHGIEHDGWGRVVAYHVYLEHPSGDLAPGETTQGLLAQTKRIRAERMIHLKLVRRINQARGVAIMHACTHRLSDLEDYEESERLAAKVAASLTGFIRKAPDMPGTLETATSDNSDRSLQMQSAMIFDNLLPGEEIQTIESKRPSNALPDYRLAMLKAVSAGTGAKASTIARTYDGTYSSQRQELVEAQPGYRRLQNYFVNTSIRRIYETALQVAQLAGVISFEGADLRTIRDARYLGPGQPWISPREEMEADKTAVEQGFKSRHQVIRERGGDPVQVDAEREQDTMETPTDEQDSEASDQNAASAA